MKMRRFISLLLVPMALLLTVPAHAVAPSVVTGTFYITSFNPLKVRTVGTTTFETANDTFTASGGMQGVAVGTTSFIIDNVNGLISFTGQQTFTGVVAGSLPGSIQMRVSGNATSVGGYGTPLTSIFELFVLHNGAGGLTGIHGVGTDMGSGANTLSYTLTVHSTA